MKAYGLYGILKTAEKDYQGSARIHADKRNGGPQ
jgi:hypothetical protein